MGGGFSTVFVVCLLYLVEQNDSFRIISKVEGCTSESKPGDLCKLTPDDVKPSQFGIGGLEVECKKSRFESMSDKELTDYLEGDTHRVQIIVGPGGDFYLIDGHHMTKALYDADVDDKLKIIYCDVLENWEKLSKEEFWQAMLEENKLWLYDEKGTQPIAPEHLATHISKVLDDPFRTLAWMIQSSGGYLKVGVPFEDFMWANFLRDNIHLVNGTLKIQHQEGRISQISAPIEENRWTWCEVRPSSSVCLSNQAGQLKKVLPIALNLAASPAASYLPGYGEGSKEPVNCGNSSSLSFISTMDW